MTPRNKHPWTIALGASVAVAALVLGQLLVPARSNAFWLDRHEDILRAALPAATPTGGVDTVGMTEIIGTYFSGKGNRGSDKFQHDAFRHFDSAATPADVCKRADDAGAFFTRSIGTVKPAGEPAFDDVTNGPAARSDFGGLTHALQDFYSHSNWVELAVAAGHAPEPAPLFPCDLAKLPAALYTGFFESTLSNPLGGCPKKNGKPDPPKPFAECHLTLNKDYHDRGKGKKTTVLNGATVSWYKLASDVAIKHTRELYQRAHSGLSAQWTPAKDDIDGTCVITNLFQPTRKQRCLNISGAWRVSATDYPAAPPVGAIFTFTHSDWKTVSGTLAGRHCQDGRVALSASGASGFSGTMESCARVGPSQHCPTGAVDQMPLSLTWRPAGGARALDAVLSVAYFRDVPGCPVEFRTDHTFTLVRP